MSEDVLGYSSHDWRKHTDDAVVVDDRVEHKALKVNNSRFIKFKKLNVNSFHNYGIEKINKKFKIISKSNDGLIEIAEHNNKKILCMMFHPERSCGSQIKLRRIICDYFKIK